jgi:hypothetical protein
LFVENSDQVAHSISQISVSAPFAVDGINRSLPAQIGSHGYLSVEISIEVPVHPGTYSLPTLTLTAS